MNSTRRADMRRVYRIAGNLAAMQPDAAPLLEAVDVRKSYGGREALKGVSLQVRSGELLACIGPNGAGKTTLLTILASVQRADSGTVATEGQVGWVPQQPALYSKLTVAENLRLFARLDRVPDVEEAVARMLSQTGLADRADEQVARLSGGNRQRVNVAIGLMSSPPVLLLDEPSTALDPRQRDRLWAFVATLAREGRGVVYSTHVVSEVERHADRVLVLGDGEQLFSGTPAELAETVGGPRDSFEHAFVSFLEQRGH
jgi:ABC-2 type transport system ATP-binding protein